MSILFSPQRLKKDYFDENVIKLGIDISNALILCEKEHIVHGNIKPFNILVSKDEEYKLSDFSMLKMRTLQHQRGRRLQFFISAW